MRWIRQQEEQGEESQEAKKRTRQQCLKADTYRKEDSCNEDEEEEGQEIYAKLSAIHVIKRDTSVATAHSTCGTHKIIKTHGIDEAKDEKQ